MKYILKTSLMLCCWLILFSASSAEVSAQGFAVETKVYDDSQPNSPVISRNISIFHAGEVFDYLDREGEVIIMQPTQNKFIILNERANVKTEFTFKKIESYLRLIDEETDRFLGGRTRKKNEKKEINLIRFHHEPTFSKVVDVQHKQLNMTSPFLSYTVDFTNDRPEEYARRYHDFADWVRKLNYVRHPMEITPKSRLQLNEHLRSIKALPMKIRMTAETSQLSVHLRSEHFYHWELNSMHRKMINRWNSKIKSENTRTLRIAEFQEGIHSLQ